jgi:RNA polymerase sigma factor (sigma-70 family)
MKGPAPSDEVRLEEEARLITRAQAGDRSALRPLFERYGPVLYSAVILPRLGNVAEAEDVLKETMLSAVEHLDRFTWQGRSVYHWLRQIAANKIIDVHRRRQRGGRLVDALLQELDVHLPEPPGAEEALIAAEERQQNRRRIDGTLAAIPPRYAEAIRLRLVEELPRSVCAERLGVTIGTFDVLFFRALAAFRKQWTGEEEA